MSYELEEELLIVISRLNLNDKQKIRISELCEETLNWDYLIRRAGDEGVDSLLYHHLKKLVGQGFSLADSSNSKELPYNLKELSARYYSNLLSNIHLLDEFYEVLKRLHGIGIQVILLKGIYLIEKIYKNAGLRPMSDVDVLIKKEAIPLIMGEMSKAGYSLTPHGHLGFLKDGEFPALIDFHWDIWFPGTEDLWKRCVGQSFSFASGNIQAFTPDNEDMLIYMSVHQSVNHGMHKLIWLCDIHEFIRTYRDNIDWESFIERVRSYNIEIPLYSTLSYTKELLKTEIPSVVLEAFKPLKSDSFKARVYRKTTTNHYTVDVGHILYLLLLKGWRRRIAYMIKYIFPERDFLVKRYSLSSSRVGYLYYIVRPLLLFFKSIKAIYQIVF
ncbi:MAG: nucleotidyltransferase family protein [Nitrospinae bacterium]|nr:nucleotidyltransferase family protein [Nitrospinota bacterium]